MEADDLTKEHTAFLDARQAQVHDELESYASAIALATNPHAVAVLTAKMHETACVFDELRRESERVSQRGQNCAQARAHLCELGVLPDLKRKLPALSYELKRRTLTSLGLQVYVEPRRKPRSPEMPPFHVKTAMSF